MKFYVETKKYGEKIKKKIRKLCDKKEAISLAEVVTIFGHTPADGTDEKFWSSEDVKKKMRLRETKNGWFIYIPGEPKSIKFDDLTLTIFSDQDLENLITKVMTETILAKGNINKPCLVVSHPTKNSVREEKGIAIGHYQLAFTKSSGEDVAFPVFLVLMDPDKHGRSYARQVKPENIIFLKGDE